MATTLRFLMLVGLLGPDGVDSPDLAETIRRGPGWTDPKRRLDFWIRSERLATTGEEFDRKCDQPSLHVVAVCTGST